MDSKRCYRYKNLMISGIGIFTALVLVSVLFAGEAGAQFACEDLYNVQAWNGRVSFEYSHADKWLGGQADKENIEFNYKESGSGSARLESFFKGGGTWQGISTGTASYDEKYTTNWVGDPPSQATSVTMRGSGSLVSSYPNFDLSLTGPCTYTFDFMAPTNVEYTYHDIFSDIHYNTIISGGVLGNLPITGMVLRGSGSFPAECTVSGSVCFHPYGVTTPGDEIPSGRFGSATVTWEFIPTDDSMDEPCKEFHSSVIECENQVLGESLDITGTPFSLNYKSNRAPGSNIGTWLSGGWYAKTQGIGGWTLDVHHFFDPDFKVLHLGNGERRNDLMQVVLSNNISIPSEDGSEIYVFNRTGWHLRTLDALTGAVRYKFTYDSAGRLKGITDGDGNTVTIERNASGNATAMVSPYGQRTLLTMDSRGYLASITNPKGESTRLGYTKISRATPLLCGGIAICLPYINTIEGLLVKLTDPKGKLHTFSYDNNARLVKDTDPAGGFKTLERKNTNNGYYDTNGYSVTLSTGMKRNTTYLTEILMMGEQRRLITFPGGLQTETKISTNTEKTNYFNGMNTTSETGFDPRFGLLAQVPKNQTIKTPGGLIQTIISNRTAVLADPNNSLSLKSLTDIKSINGLNYTITFNKTSKIITTRTPMGRQTVTVLDNKGRIAEERISGIASIKYIYDARGRPSIINQGTRNYTLRYDAKGNLANITDPLSHIQGFKYDAAGRMIKQILPDGRQIQYTYDASGNVISITPPGRPNHNFSYTPVDLLGSYLPPKVGLGTNPTRYNYNIDKQLTRITRPDGVMVNFSYDTAGRLNTIKQPQGSISTTYDPATGNIKAITAPGGSTITYRYDGSLLLYTNWSGVIAGSVHHTYDNNFSIVSEDVNGKNAINFRYDKDGLLIKAGTLNMNRNSQNGLLTGTSIGNVTDTLSYNSFAEVTSYKAAFKGKNIFSVQFTRDNIGRIIKKNENINGTAYSYNYTYDTAGRLINVRKNGLLVSKYVYDANGNRLNYTGKSGTINGTYDNQDRLTKYGTTMYTYTANGDLSRKTVTGQNTTYQYDVLGNLINVTLPGGKQIRYLVDGQNRRIGKKINGTMVQGFLYKDGLRPIAELDKNNNIISRFVYASGRNVPDFMVKGSVTYRIFTDHLGSPRLVVNAATGALAQKMDYDEFGKIITDYNPGFQPFGFAGGLYDRDTKLVRFGARDYDVEVGRWTAKDPILFKGSQGNLYGYVLNDPINHVDPFGLSDSECYCKYYYLPPFDYGHWGDTAGIGAGLGGAAGFVLTWWSGPGAIFGAAEGALALGSVGAVGYPLLQGLDWLLDRQIHDSKDHPRCR